MLVEEDYILAGLVKLGFGVGGDLIVQRGDGDFEGDYLVR